MVELGRWRSRQQRMDLSVVCLRDRTSPLLRDLVGFNYLPHCIVSDEIFSDTRWEVFILQPLGGTVPWALLLALLTLKEAILFGLATPGRKHIVELCCQSIYSHLPLESRIEGLSESTVFL